MLPRPDDTQWMLERIEAARVEIVAIEAKILVLCTGPLKYNLNTSQTQQSVEQQQLDQFRIALAAAENRKATLEARLYGTSIHATFNF